MEKVHFSLPEGDPLKLSSYLKKYKKEFWIQTIGGVLYNTVIVSGPVILGKAIDAAANLYNNGIYDTGVQNLLLACGAFVLVTIFFQYARYIKRWYIRNMSNRIANDMRAGLISMTLDRDMCEIDMESVGDLMSRTVGDVDQIVSTVQSTINEAWDTWLLMISYFAVLMVYSPVITLICSIPVPVAMFSAESVRHPLYKFSTNARKTASLINSHLQKTISGIITLRLFGREEIENERLKEYSKKQMEWNIKTALLQNGMMPVYAALASLGIAGVIGFGGKQVIDGYWSVGYFTSYLTMFSAMAVRTWVAARVFNQFHSAKAAWHRIKEKLKSKQTVPQVKDIHKEVCMESDGDVPYIKAECLGFTYPGACSEVLKQVSFEVKEGSLVGITGPVGSGKSTLAAVLSGLYEYTGSIRVEGRELISLSKEERLSKISYSGQEPFLFSASIRENITFNEYEKDSERLKEALYISALYDDLEIFPEGADTMVGEKGIRISGGQKQRVSLARAIYSDSSVLILDDPFSAVDIGTEDRMIDRLKKCLSGKTVFLFSHRLHAFKDADHIIVLDSGSISEHGTHDELMKKDGIYRRIYIAQDWMESEENEYR